MICHANLILAFVFKGAIPQIIKNTNDDFLRHTISVLRQTADICYDKLKEIDCISCPSKPEGTMFVMVRRRLAFVRGPLLIHNLLSNASSCR